jgi:hypothetical protein
MGEGLRTYYFGCTAQFTGGGLRCAKSFTPKIVTIFQYSPSWRINFTCVFAKAL